MIASKETEVLGSFGEIPKQLKKLKNKEERKFDRALGKFQGFDFSHRLDHFQVAVNKSGVDGEGKEDHF